VQSIVEMINTEVKKLGQQYGINPITELKGDVISVKISGEEVANALMQMIKPEYKPLVKIKAGEIVIELRLR
jgi:hypothetical protein